jgi:hypothetical protein
MASTEMAILGVFVWDEVQLFHIKTRQLVRVVRDTTFLADDNGLRRYYTPPLFDICTIGMQQQRVRIACCSENGIDVLEVCLSPPEAVTATSLPCTEAVQPNWREWRFNFRQDLAGGFQMADVADPNLMPADDKIISLTIDAEKAVIATKHSIGVWSVPSNPAEIERLWSFKPLVQTLLQVPAAEYMHVLQHEGRYSMNIACCSKRFAVVVGSDTVKHTDETSEGSSAVVVYDALGRLTEKVRSECKSEMLEEIRALQLQQEAAGYLYRGEPLRDDIEAPLLAEELCAWVEPEEAVADY